MGRRWKTGKFRYRDDIAAKLALAKLKWQDKEGHIERRAYHCLRCRGWCPTSKKIWRRNDG